MTSDQAVALSLVPDLPRPGLTERLCADDPTLLEAADALLDKGRRVQRQAARRGIQVIAWNDRRFPPSLLAIADCPPALWYRGSLSPLDEPCVAIVGSRAASAVAIETAARLGSGLAAQGVTVISGLARGVDSAGHRAALTSGATVAVLGSGVDRVYPPEHEELAGRIAAGGLLVSEYPLGTPPLPFHFPMRNRLISGLCRAVIVIEASDKSGSLITAQCALEQGRDVMAVPGNVLSGRNKGGHALIRDGAAIVETALDVLQQLGLATSDGATNSPTSSARTTSTDPVLRCMDEGQAYDLESLSNASGLRSAQLLTRLLNLELAGFVTRAGGGRFVRR